MIPMEPGPEDYRRMLAERRAEMERSREIARFAHSRTRVLGSFLRSIAEQTDPTGRRRKELG